MRERDLKSLEYDKVIHLVMDLCASEPGRETTAAIQPSTDLAEVRERLRATAEMVELRSHSGSIPIGEFVDQRLIDSEPIADADFLADILAEVHRPLEFNHRLSLSFVISSPVADYRRIGKALGRNRRQEPLRSLRG